MRAAEQSLVINGTNVETLMERAGTSLAEAVWRFAANKPVLVLCGPGNNGGDGYVAARLLAQQGLDVRLAALSEPSAETAKRAREKWAGPVENLESAAGAPVIVDALFGTGLSRPLSSAIHATILRLKQSAGFVIAADMPSGVHTDDGTILGAIEADVTVAFGAAKPAHFLSPSAAFCGHVFVADIGFMPQTALTVIDRPFLAAPSRDDHKYTRGMVIVVAGPMQGASVLAALSAQRAGAGYVVLADGPGNSPYSNALVHASLTEIILDRRTNAAVIGPGLGKDDDAKQKVMMLINSDLAIVIDGDGLGLVGEIGVETLARRRAPTILTPHAGEFDRLFGSDGGNKIERTRAAARRSGATVIFKGADTVVASHDGQARMIGAADSWLSTAGTGDVLAGICAAMLARGLGGLDAASAALWLHNDAARIAGPGLIADDLPNAIRFALVACS
jgi:ADP-dependent NAD(P)H-hydrate dehydratase / NAD(P)H-hydrate epimerase